MRGWARRHGGAAQSFWSVRYDEALDDLLRGGGLWGWHAR